MKKDALPRTDSLALVTLLGHACWDHLHSFDFVAFCESDSVASRIDECQTHRTVGLTLLALKGNTGCLSQSGELPRLV